MPTLTFQWKSDAQKKARLYLDDEWWMTLEREVLEVLGLEQGMELTEEGRDEIAHKVADEKAKLFVLRSLSARAQTRSELERKLKDREIPEGSAERALSMAEEYGFIDDSEVARAHARGLRERGYWRGRARMKLREKGVEQTLSDEVLDEVFERDDELEAALAALKGRSVGTDPKEFKRAVDFLLRRGFSYSAAAGAVRSLVEASRQEADLLDEGRDGTGG